jgi:hypothetical protein
MKSFILKSIAYIVVIFLFAVGISKFLSTDEIYVCSNGDKIVKFEIEEHYTAYFWQGAWYRTVMVSGGDQLTAHFHNWPRRENYLWSRGEIRWSKTWWPGGPNLLIDAYNNSNFVHFDFKSKILEVRRVDSNKKTQSIFRAVCNLATN